MIKYNTPQELFTAICDKIRDKTNSNELINHQDIPDKINNLVDSGIKLFIDSAIQGKFTIYYNFNNTTITKISSRIFSTTNLTTVNLPKCTSIGDSAFNSCTNLTTVNLPKCTSIDNYAFNYCNNLTTIILSNNQIVTLKDIRAFNNSSIANGTGYIYVPDNLVDSYKTATNWSTYANQIKPLSELSN